MEGIINLTTVRFAFSCRAFIVPPPHDNLIPNEHVHTIVIKVNFLVECLLGNFVHSMYHIHWMSSLHAEVFFSRIALGGLLVVG